ncbi:hypothetical protein Ciccas_007632 [Cichlidogyrus casuarinus]|uniref:Uncharacterized protein n=1 Tax=Cichlidogyrus casuarinus TaxID=1844966 RepID=A0ABD2Q2E4_9PLAT
MLPRCQSGHKEPHILHLKDFLKISKRFHLEHKLLLPSREIIEIICDLCPLTNGPETMNMDFDITFLELLEILGEAVHRIMRKVEESLRAKQKTTETLVSYSGTDEEFTLLMPDGTVTKTNKSDSLKSTTQPLLAQGKASSLSQRAGTSKVKTNKQVSNAHEGGTQSSAGKGAVKKGQKSAKLTKNSEKNSQEMSSDVGSFAEKTQESQEPEIDPIMAALEIPFSLEDFDSKEKYDETFRAVFSFYIVQKLLPNVRL